MSHFAGKTSCSVLLRVTALTAIVCAGLSDPARHRLLAQPAPQEDRPRLILSVQGPQSRTRTVAFSRDSQRIYTAGFSKVVDIWDVGWNKAADLPGPVAATPVRTLRWEIARGNRGVINVMAVSPTREQIAIGGFSARGSNGDIIIYDTDRAQVEASLPPERDARTSLPGHRQSIISLDYSPDGNRIVSVSFDGEMWVWTAPAQPGGPWTPRLIRQAYGSLFDRQPAIFIDNNTIVAAERVTPNVDTRWRLVLYNVQGQQLGVLPQIHNIRVSALTRSPDGITWFSATGRDANNAASASTIFVWTGRGQQPPRILRSYNREPSSLSAGPGGLLAASNFLSPTANGRQQAVVELYDVPSGRLIDQVEVATKEHCLSCQISPDGTRLITHSDDRLELMVYDLVDDNGQLLPKPLSAVPPVRLRGRGRNVFHVAFAVPGQGEDTLRIGLSQDESKQIDRVFSPADGTLLPPDESDRFVVPTAFSDGWTVEFSPANIADGTQTVTLTHPQRGQSRIVLNVPRQGTFNGVHCLIPDAQGRAFAVALGTDTQNGIFVYQLPAGPNGPILLRYFRDHSGAVTSVGVATDGRYLVSGARDKTVKIWSLAGLTRFDPRVPERTRWGAEFRIENGQVVARNVLNAGIAFARRVQNGDVIAQITYADANGWQQPTDAPTILNRLRTQQVFETSTLGIRHNGREEALDLVPVVPGWEPLLTLFVDETDEWALFTPEGYYDSSIAEGAELFGWQVNRGRNFTPRFERAENLQHEFEKPDVIREVLRRGSVIDALTALTLPVPDDPREALAEKIREIPEIRIDEPVQSANFDVGDNVTVQARIVLPANKQLDDLQIRAHQSGRSLGEPEIVQANGRDVIVRWKAQPLDALDTFSVTAKDKGRSVQNSPQQIDTVKVRGTPDPQAEEEGELHVLALASEAYRPGCGFEPLNFSIDDVEDVRDRFTEDGSRWKLTPGYDQILKDRQVTKASVLAAIRTIQKRASSPHDVLIFYISGHGKLDDTENEFYYIPVSIEDGNDPENIRKHGISWTSICDALKDVPCRVVWMLDTCHSGSVVRSEITDQVVSGTASSGRSAAGTPRGGPNGASTNRELARAQVRNARNPNQFVLAATGSRSAAFEDASYKVDPDDAGHGLFTYFVLRGLDGEADTFRKTGDRNRVTDVFELAEFVRFGVTVESGRDQQPVATPTPKPLPRVDESPIELLRVPNKRGDQ